MTPTVVDVVLAVYKRFSGARYTRIPQEEFCSGKIIVKLRAKYMKIRHKVTTITSQFLGRSIILREPYFTLEHFGVRRRHWPNGIPGKLQAINSAGSL